MSRFDYAANIGAMGADDLRKVFGLKAGTSTYSEGSSTGVKGNPTLGEGYLDKKTYNRLKNSDEIWDAYAAVNGQEAMEEKREGNPDGLSINALDATLDRMSDGQKEEIIGDELPTFNEATFSPQVQEAIDRAQNYRDRAWSGEAAQEIYGKSKDPLSGYSAGHTSSSGSANAGDQATQSYFNSEKYKIDLKNKRAQSEAAQA